MIVRRPAIRGGNVGINALEESDVIAAAKDVLDRAGVRRLDGHTLQPAQDGTILWEEFVQIHRRMVSEGNETTTTSSAPLELPATSSAARRSLDGGRTIARWRTIRGRWADAR